MSEFEYLAVFMSIIFGISTTHILSGVIRSIYRGQLDQTHFVLTAFFFWYSFWTGGPGLTGATRKRGPLVPFS